MKKTLFEVFGAAVLIILITIAFPIKENPVVEETTVSIQQEIVYAYISTEMRTNGYGGVHGHQDYICYGVLDGDNICDKEDRVDYVVMRRSEKDHSYIEYYYDRKIYEDGTNYDRYAGAALYLTDDMMRNLRANG